MKDKMQMSILTSDGTKIYLGKVTQFGYVDKDTHTVLVWDSEKPMGADDNPIITGELTFAQWEHFALLSPNHTLILE